MRLLETADGVVLEVNVKPNSKKFRVELEGDEVVVLCREVPVNGRVNRELAHAHMELSRLFNRSVDLVSGFSSRQKRVLISDVEADEVNRVLAFLKASDVP